MYITFDHNRDKAQMQDTDLHINTLNDSIPSNDSAV